MVKYIQHRIDIISCCATVEQIKTSAAMMRRQVCKLVEEVREYQSQQH
jgi:hypothetical protein